MSGTVSTDELEKYKDFVGMQMLEANKRIFALEEEICELRKLMVGDLSATQKRAAKLYMHLRAVGRLSRTEASQLLDNTAPETARRAMQECAELYEDVVFFKGKGKDKQLYLILKESANAQNN